RTEPCRNGAVLINRRRANARTCFGIPNSQAAPDCNAVSPVHTKLVRSPHFTGNTDDPSPVPAELAHLDRCLMLEWRPYLFAGGCVPDAHRAVLGRTDHPTGVLVKRDVGYPFGVHEMPGDSFTRLGVPDLGITAGFNRTATFTFRCTTGHAEQF